MKPNTCESCKSESEIFRQVPETFVRATYTYTVDVEDGKPTLTLSASDGDGADAAYWLGHITECHFQVPSNSPPQVDWYSVLANDGELYLAGRSRGIELKFLPEGFAGSVPGLDS